MKTYTLSFTGLFSDRKEYVVAFNKHRNVLNTNDYIVAFNPWSRFTADIIDDMKLAKKRAVKTHKSLIKDAELASSFNAVIDKTTAQARIVSNAVQLPIVVERFLYRVQAKVDSEISKASIYGNANIMEMQETVQRIVAQEAVNTKQEVASMVARSYDAKVSETFNALTMLRATMDNELGETLLLPYAASNTKLDLSSLVAKAGYRTDKLDAPNKIKDILVGDNINTQLTGIMMKHVYKATTDIQAKGHLIKKDFIKSMGETATMYKDVYTARLEQGLEETSLIYPGTGVVKVLESSTAVLTSRTDNDSDLPTATPVLSSDGSMESNRIEAGTVISGAKTDTKPVIEGGIFLSARKTVIEYPENAKVILSRYVQNPSVLEVMKVLKVFNITGGVAKLEEAKALLVNPTLQDRMEMATITIATPTIEDNMDEAKVLNTVSSNSNGGSLLNADVFKAADTTSVETDNAKVIQTYKGIYPIVENVIEALWKKEFVGHAIGSAESATLYTKMNNGVIIGTDLAEISDQGDIEVELSIMSPVDQDVKEYEVAIAKITMDKNPYREDEVSISSIDVAHTENVTLDTDMDFMTEVDLNIAVQETDVQELLNVNYQNEHSVLVETLETPYNSERVYDTQFEHLEGTYSNIEQDVDLQVTEKAHEESTKDIALEYFEGATELTLGLLTVLEESLGAALEANLLDTSIMVYEDAQQEHKLLDVAIDVQEVGETIKEEDVLIETVETFSTIRTDIDTVIEYGEQGHVDGEREVFINVLENSFLDDSGRIVELEELEESEATRGSLDVALEHTELADTESALDTTLEELEVFEFYDNPTETALDEYTEFRFSTTFTETDLQEVSEFRFSENFGEAYYDVLSPYNTSIAQLDTELQEEILVGYLGDMDVSINVIEGYDRTTEYPATAHEISDATDVYVTTELEVREQETFDKLTGGKMHISDREEATPSDKNVDAYLADDELGDKVASGTAVVSEGELADKKAGGKMTISDGELGDNATEFDSELTETDLADTVASGTAEIREGETATQKAGGKMEIGGQDLAKHPEPEYEATDTETVLADEIVNKVAEVREMSSADRLRLLRGEIHRGETTELPEKPATVSEDDIGEGKLVPPQPTEKKKIWSIMGKNYPAWNNWNPKKTR